MMCSMTSTRLVSTCTFLGHCTLAAAATKLATVSAWRMVGGVVELASSNSSHPLQRQKQDVLCS